MTRLRRIHAASWALIFMSLGAVSMFGFRSWADETGSLEAFRKLQSDLNVRIERDLKEANAYLEELIAKDPDSEDLNVLRHALAAAFLRDEKYDLASQQFQKLLEYQIQHIDQSQNQYGIWATVQSMQKVAQESRDGKPLRSAVDLAHAALEKLELNADAKPLIPISQIAVLKAQFLVDDEETEAASQLVSEQLENLKKANSSDGANEQAMRAWVTTLMALTTNDPANDDWRGEYAKELVALTESAIDKYPSSRLLQKYYAETQYLMVTRWGQEDVEARKKRIDDVSEKLKTVATRNRSVQAVLRRIDLLREEMAAAKPVETLVGKPAPEWDIDAWVNVIAMDREQLKGKVVLLDFWAMWCGPCIATFPHLREWREEFGDDGFEIVGVTQYYNFEWDDERKRASRADDEISAEDEQATLASFLEHHKLGHPVIVTPKGSKMSGAYGVRGIPHVVLIDRDGTVQLVKTGAGQATANEIHAKIKELLGKK